MVSKVRISQRLSLPWRRAIASIGAARAFVASVVIAALRLVAAGFPNRTRRQAMKIAALTRVHEVAYRLWLSRDLNQALNDILAGAIELLGADKGNIQGLDTKQRVLKIVASQGFEQDFLNFFREVSANDCSACGRALRSGERLVIEDVESDALFTLLRPAARAAGFRAVQSTPILSRAGAPLGMLSTHFRSVHRPSDEDLALLDLYVRQVGDILERHQLDNALHESEERFRLTTLQGTSIGHWEWNLRTEEFICTPP